MITEYETLKEVLLYYPTSPFIYTHTPESVHHIEMIDTAALAEEYYDFLTVLMNLNIKSHLINESIIDQRDWSCRFNLIYCRDQFFRTLDGCVMAAMKSPLRQKEIPYSKATLLEHQIPVIAQLKSPSTLEGADVIHLAPGHVAIGIGNRTNIAGFKQAEMILTKQGITVHPLIVPHGIQHLLGVLHIVDYNLVLLRVALVDPTYQQLLSSFGFKIIPIPEHSEVTTKQAMNIVTVSPRVIIMPTDCPTIKNIYQDNGLEIAAEIKIAQLIKGAGGLACATGVISRKE